MSAQQPLQAGIQFQAPSPEEAQMLQERNDAKAHIETFVNALSNGHASGEFDSNQATQYLNAIKEEAHARNLDIEGDLGTGFHVKDQYDIGRAVGDFASGAAEGVGGLIIGGVQAVADSQQAAQQAPPKLMFGDQELDVPEWLKPAINGLVGVQQLGQQYIGNPIDAALQDPNQAFAAAVTKTAQLTDSIPRELYNSGVDFNNAARGYPEFQTMSDTGTGAKQFAEQYAQGNQGMTAEDLLHKQPAINFVGDVAPFAIPEVGGEAVLSKLLKANRLGKIVKAAVKLTGEAGAGAVAANVDPALEGVENRAKARGQMAGQVLTLATGAKIVKGAWDATLGKKRLGVPKLSQNEIDKAWDEMVQQPGNKVEAAPAETKPVLKAETHQTVEAPKSAKESATVLNAATVETRVAQKLGVDPEKVRGFRVIKDASTKKWKATWVETQTKVEDASKKTDAYREVTLSKKDAKGLDLDNKANPSGTVKAKITNRSELPGYEKPVEKAKTAPKKVEPAKSNPRARIRQIVRNNEGTEVHYKDTKGETHKAKAESVSMKGVNTPDGTIPYKRVAKITGKNGEVHFIKDRTALKKKLEASAKKTETTIKVETKQNTEAHAVSLEKAGATVEDAQEMASDLATPYVPQTTFSNDLAVITQFADIGRHLKGQGLHAEARVLGEQHSFRLGTINEANAWADRAKKAFAKRLGKNINWVNKNVFESGKYRGWHDGVVLDSELTPKELKAYTQLKNINGMYNSKFNIPIMENYFGFKPGVLDPHHASSARAGLMRYTFWADHVPDAELQKAGIKTFVDAGDGRVHLTPGAQFTLDYGDSKAEIIKHFQNAGEHYYERKFPFMYDSNGKFLEAHVLEQQNPHRFLLDLSDSNKITPAQSAHIKTTMFDTSGNLKPQYVAAGYDAVKVKDILNKAINGQIDPSALHTRLYRAHVGALKSKEGIKVGTTIDVLDTNRKLTIQLTNKALKDKTVAALRTTQVAIDAELKTIRQQRTSAMLDVDSDLAARELDLVRQQRSLEYLEALVRNQPLPWSEFLNKTTESFLGPVNGKKAIRATTKLGDQFFHIQTIWKMGMSLSTALVNPMEARFGGTTALMDKTLSKKACVKIASQWLHPNVGKFKGEVAARMAASKKYGNLYKEVPTDRDADVAFVGKGKTLLDTAGKNWNAAMMHSFKYTFREGQMSAYRMFEIAAEDKKLTGEAKEDFIYDHMVEAGQVAQLSQIRATASRPIRLVTFLQNFNISKVPYQLSLWEKYAQDSKNKTILHNVKSPAFKKAVFGTFAMVSAAGLEASPLVLGGVKGYEALAALTYMATNGQINLPTYEKAKASPNTLPGKQENLGDHLNTLAVYGIPGYMGIDPTAIKSDPYDMPKVLTVKSDIQFTQDLGMSLKLAADAPDAKSGIDILMAGVINALKAYLTTEITAAARLGQAGNIMTQGKVINRSGKTVEIIPEDQKVGRAVDKLTGLRHTSENQAGAVEQLVKTNNKNLREINTAEMKQLRDTWDDVEVSKAVIDVLYSRGVSQESLIRAANTIETNKKTDANDRVLIQAVQPKAYENLQKTNPELLDQIMKTK